MGARQSGASASQRMKSTRGLFIGLFIAAVVVAGVLSFYASSSPDGLEKVAADKGLNAKERDHSVKDSPLTHYSIKGVSNGRVSVGLAGIIGVVVIAVAADKDERVSRTDIESIAPSTVSLMPAGMEQQLTPQELADLIAFLRACK